MIFSETATFIANLLKVVHTYQSDFYRGGLIRSAPPPELLQTPPFQLPR